MSYIEAMKKKPWHSLAMIFCFLFSIIGFPLTVAGYIGIAMILWPFRVYIMIGLCFLSFIAAGILVTFIYKEWEKGVPDLKEF